MHIFKYDSGDEDPLNTRMMRRYIGPSLFILSWLFSSCFPSVKDPTRKPLTSAPALIINELPSTWTKKPPTNTPEPTTIKTPTEAPAATGTLSPTLTSTSITLPTQNPEVSATPFALLAQLPDCRYTASKPGVEILPGPFVDLYRVLPTMEPGKVYPVVIDKPTYSLILEDGEPIGWVDYRIIYLSMDGTQCLTRRDERELTELDTLCFFTPYEEIEGYSQPGETEISHPLHPEYSYVVLAKYQEKYFSAFGHAGPSFYVDRESVFTHGNCDSVPSIGNASMSTALYSLPDGEKGAVMTSINKDQILYIQTSTQEGEPPPNSIKQGVWVQVKLRRSEGGLVGWFWSEFLEYK